jgi:hypothetical protein
MKYIKKFNENFLLNLTEFCDNHLVSLKDIGVTCEVIGNKYYRKDGHGNNIFVNYDHTPDYDCIILTFNKWIGVKFSTISDDLIPFLIMLGDKFDISDILVVYIGLERVLYDYKSKLFMYNYTIEELDNNIHEECIINTIYINIKSN